MHPGGAGTPPAGGGSGAPRPGTARPGQGDRDPRGRCPVPAWLGWRDPPPQPLPGPQRRLVPPAQPCRGGRPNSGVPLNTGCPRGGGSPWHHRVPPGQTAEDHQAQLDPVHRGDARSPQHPTSVTHTTLSTPSSGPSLLQPGRLKPPGPAPTPGLPSPPPMLLAQHPSGHPLPQLPPSAGVPPWSHTSPAPAPASPFGPSVRGSPPMHVNMYIHVCPLHVFVGLRGAHGCDSAGAHERGHIEAVPWDAPCSMVWPFLGDSLWTRGRGATPHGDLPWVSEERPTGVAPVPPQSPVCVPSAHPNPRLILALSSCIFLCQGSDCTN